MKERPPLRKDKKRGQGDWKGSTGRMIRGEGTRREEERK